MAAKVEIILQGTDNASKPIRDVNQALTDVGEKGKGSFNILQNAASSALGFIGAQAGIAFAGMVTSAVSAGAEYGAVMNRIQAVSGATAGEMDLINKQALKLGADLPISAADAAQGMYALVTAGYSAKDAIAASGGVAALAASQQMEVGRASEIVSAALRGFGLEADQAGRVTDLLSQTASRSAVEVADVGETLKYVGPVAGALKQPMEDVAVAIGLMGNAGVKGEMAGTALRSMLSNMAAPTKEASGVLNQLGIEITNTDGTMRPLTDIMQQFRDKTAGMTDTQKASVAQTIAGKEAMSGFLAIVGASQTDFDGMKSAMENANGATDRFASSMNKGLKFEIEQLKGSIETVLIQGFQAVEPVMVGVVSAITPLVNQVGETLPGAMAAAQTAWDTVLQPAFAAVGSFLEETVFPALGTAVAWFQDNIPTAMGGVESAWSGTLQPALQAVWDFLEGTIFPVLGALVTWYASTIPIAIDAMQTAWDEVLKPVFQAVWDVLDSTLFPILGTLAKWFVEGIPVAIEAVQTAWSTVLKPALQALGDFIQDPVVPVLTALARWFDENLPTAIAAIETAWSTVLKPALSALWAFIVDHVVPILGTLAVAVGATLETAFGVAKTAWDNILYPILSALWAFIVDPLAPILATLAVAVGATLETAFNVAKAAWDNVLYPILSALWAFILDPVVPILGTLAGAVGAGLETAFGLAKTAWNSVLKPALDGIVNFVRDTLLPGITNIQTKWAEVWNNVKNKLTTLIPDLIATVTGLINDIKTKFTETDWGALGKAVLDGIIAGIRSGVGGLREAAQNAAQSLLDAAKGALSISSPSQVMADQVGVPIVEGIISGMQESTASLTAATLAVASAVVGGLSMTTPGAASVGAATTTAFAAGLSESTAAMSLATTSEAVASLAVTAMTAAAPAATQTGQSIMDGFASGVRSGGQTAIDTTREVVDEMAELMKTLATRMGAADMGIVEPGSNDADRIQGMSEAMGRIASSIKALVDMINLVTGESGRAAAEAINLTATRDYFLWITSVLLDLSLIIASSAGAVQNQISDTILGSLKRINDLLGPIKTAVTGTVGLVNTILEDVAGTLLETALNDGPMRQWIINLAQAMVQWANDIGSAVDDINVTVNADALPDLKLLADILAPIKSAVDTSVGMVVTLLKDVGGTTIETVLNDAAARQWIINLAQAMVQWGNDIGSAADDVQVTIDEKALPGLKLLTNTLSPITKAFNDTLSIIGMLNSEWREPEDVSGGATRLTQIGVAVASSFLSLANAFTGTVTPAAEQAAKSLDMTEKYIKDVYNLGKSMAQGLAQLPANYVELTQQLVTLGKTISGTFIAEANNFDVVVGPGSEALLAVFTRLDKFYTGFNKSMQALGKVDEMPTDAGEKTRKVALLAKDIATAYLDSVNSFEDVKGEGAVNLESTIGGFADLVKDTKELLKTWEDWGTKEVTGEDIAPALALFATIMTSLKSLSGIGGQQAGTTWGDEFKNGIQTSLEGWTPFPGGGEGGAAGDGATLGQFASGGSVNRTGRYLLHAGEVVMNPQQQARLAQNLVGGGGGGRGDTYSYTVNQTVYSVTGLEDTLNWLKVQGR